MKRFCSMLMIIVMLIIGNSFAEEYDSLMIYFLDVGQADAAILRCEDDYMMIDGGNKSDSDFIYSFLKTVIGISELDYVVATHPHEDHIGGLSAVLNACKVGTVYSPVKEFESKEFVSLLKYADRQGTEIIVPDAYERFSLGTAIVDLYAPSNDLSDLNNSSIITKVTHGENTFLFMGDAEIEEERELIESGFKLKSKAIKIGHHGSDTSTSEEFLKSVDPQYAIISTGATNGYAYPSSEVLDRLAELGVELYRTDLQGTIICRSNSNGELTFYTSRKESEKNLFEPGGKVGYIGNPTTMIFHLPDCPTLENANMTSKIEISSRSKAISMGYAPCKRCSP